MLETEVEGVMVPDMELLEDWESWPLGLGLLPLCRDRVA